MGKVRGVGGGVPRGWRVVNRGELLLLHRGLVLVGVVVARVTGVAPAPLATSCCATLPAGGAVVVRVGGGLGLRLRLCLGASLWQQRRRSGLSLVEDFICLFHFVSFCLNLSRQILSAKLQGF